MLESKPLLPCVAGCSNNRIINILLINPNSSEYMTKQCLDAISKSLPSDVIVHGFTAPYPAPSAIESQTDAVLSTEACMRAIGPIASDYDAFLVACFRIHPLIGTLKEEFQQPVLGTMEAAMYGSRMLGERMGTLCTSARSQLTRGRAVAAYGFSDFVAGCEAVELGVLELDSRPREEIHAAMCAKIHRLAKDCKSDCILLGCAGMAEIRRICEGTLEGTGIRLVDGVGLGIHFLIGLVREQLSTAKSGIYRSSAEDRQKRGQQWL